MGLPMLPTAESSGQEVFPRNGKILNHAFAKSPHGKPNHCLINEYQPGIGIMPHTDGPAYFPVVATVSLGAPIVLDIHERKIDNMSVNMPEFRILQEPRSLLITTGRLYTDYLHGIANQEQDGDLGPSSIANWSRLGRPELYKDGGYDRRVRTSLTFRDVPQVVKTSKLFPGLRTASH